MRTNDLFPSRFLKAEDFEDGELRTLTVKSVDLEELGQGKDKKEKPVIYFRDSDKGLVLNKTNCSIIAKLHGDETDDWFGKKITLYAVETESFGDIVRAIRVRDTSKSRAQAVVKTPPPPEPDDDLYLNAPASEQTAPPPGYIEPPKKIEVPSKANGNGDKPKHTRAVVQTPKWTDLLKRAVSLEYVPDDTTPSAIRLLNVVGAAGIGSVNDLNLDACWTAIESHYEAKKQQN